MSRLPRGLDQSFSVAAAELGFCSAAWLFVRELDAAGGDDAVRALRDELGRLFPVLDAVVAQWLDGRRAPIIDPAKVLRACEGATTLLVVGLEADFLDALLPEVSASELRNIVLLRYSSLGDVDWERVLANYEGCVVSTDLAAFQRWAGTRTAVLTMTYGADEHSAHVHPAWLRLMGEDVRTQFRSFIGWDVLRRPMEVYPRWLVEVPASDFTEVV